MKTSRFRPAASADFRRRLRAARVPVARCRSVYELEGVSAKRREQQQGREKRERFGGGVITTGTGKIGDAYGDDFL